VRWSVITVHHSLVLVYKHNAAGLTLWRSIPLPSGGNVKLSAHSMRVFLLLQSSSLSLSVTTLFIFFLFVTKHSCCVQNEMARKRLNIALKQVKTLTFASVWLWTARTANPRRACCGVATRRQRCVLPSLDAPLSLSLSLFTLCRRSCCLVNINLSLSTNTIKLVQTNHNRARFDHCGFRLI
jgi:hypothetical protein